MEVVRIQVREGDLADAGSWLYVWRRADDGRVIYVGGTGLPPVLRTWLHLHGDGPALARVRHRYGRAMEDPFDIVAFRLPDHASRQEAKEELIRQLDDADMLAESYVGDPPRTQDPQRVGEPESVVTPMLRHLRDGLE